MMNNIIFYYIHHKTSHKDKNYTIFNLCKIYKGEKPFKMYLTWKSNEHDEKSRIIAKYGKVFSPPPSNVACLRSYHPILN